MNTASTTTGTPISLLDQLSPAVRSCIVAKSRLQKYFRGATICLQGDQTKTLKIVQSGWVKLYRVQRNGDEAVLATLTAGQSFEEIEALNGGKSPSSVEALSDCMVMHIDLSAICNCENAYREISQIVLAAASRHLNALRNDVEQLKVKTGAERLLEFLVLLSDTQNNRCDLELPFEKVVLAGKLGMRPESLSRAFGRLKPLGVKSLNRQIRIADISALKDHLQQENHGGELAA